MKFISLLQLKQFLVSDLKAFTSHVYLLINKDEHCFKEIVETLINYQKRAHSIIEYPTIALDGAQLNETELWTHLNTRSFFIPQQLIWIKNCDKIKKPLLDQLDHYLKQPSPAIQLVLSCSKFALSQALYKTCDTCGIILDVPELKPWEKEKCLVEWVQERIVREKKSLSLSLCQFLIKKVGSDEALLQSEIDKLISYCGERQEIEQADIQAICTTNFNETIWRLGDSIFARETYSAIKLMQFFLREHTSALPLLRQIRSQFQMGYQIASLLLQQSSAVEISREFPYLKGQTLERKIKQVRDYGHARFLKGILAIDEAELQLKNSSTGDELMCEMIIYKLTS